LCGERREKKKEKRKEGDEERRKKKRGESIIGNPQRREEKRREEKRRERAKTQSKQKRTKEPKRSMLLRSTSTLLSRASVERGFGAVTTVFSSSTSERMMLGSSSSKMLNRWFSATENATSLSREQRIRKKLEDEFKPSHLEVIDHSGGCPGGTVQVRIESKAFKGKSPVASHRLIYSLLSEEMKSLHALPLEVSVPKE